MPVKPAPTAKVHQTSCYPAVGVWFKKHLRAQQYDKVKLGKGNKVGTFFDYLTLFLADKEELANIFTEFGGRGAFTMPKGMIEFEITGAR